MEFIEIIKAFILGIVQGITEWLPVSSTGHLIILEDFIKLNFSEEFIDTFFVVIQLGSILAVIVLFFNKLNPIKRDKVEQKETISLWLKIVVATIPAAAIGLLFEETINEYLYNPLTVAIMLIVYGILFIVIENRNIKTKVDNLEGISYKLAFAIGIFQMLALIPGTSRSGATIVGGMLLGTSRVVVSEFSFFLAIPTMLGASALKMFKMGFSLNALEIMVLVIGSLTAFVVSLWVIKFLLDYIKKHDFKVFGYYRIILGLLLLAIYLL